MEYVFKNKIILLDTDIQQWLSVMAGVAGFEPTIAGPKPAALPLGYTPIWLVLYYK